MKLSFTYQKILVLSKTIDIWHAKLGVRSLLLHTFFAKTQSVLGQLRWNIAFIVRLGENRAVLYSEDKYMSSYWVNMMNMRLDVRVPNIITYKMKLYSTNLYTEYTSKFVVIPWGHQTWQPHHRLHTSYISTQSSETWR